MRTVRGRKHVCASRGLIFHYRAPVNYFFDSCASSCSSFSFSKLLTLFIWFVFFFTVGLLLKLRYDIQCNNIIRIYILLAVSLLRLESSLTALVLHQKYHTEHRTPTTQMCLSIHIECSNMFEDGPARWGDGYRLFSGMLTGVRPYSSDADADAGNITVARVCVILLRK